MQTPDDQFEGYLKRFHPIAPDPIPPVRVVCASRRPLSHWAGIVAVAAIVVIGMTIVHLRDNRVVVPNTDLHAVFAERHASSDPLTVRSANAWLATAPSFKAAVDDLAFRSQPSPLPQGKQSAVTVLSKEKIRL